MIVPNNTPVSLSGCNCNGGIDNRLNDTLTEFDEIFAEGDLADCNNSLSDNPNDFLGLSPTMWIIIMLAILSLGLGIIYMFKKK